MFQLTENQKAWLAALRSGEYKQTTGVLKDACGYCCLGVAADLAVKAGVCSEDEAFREKLTDRRYIARGSLSEEVKEWVGLLSRSGASFEDDDGGVEFFSCAGMNDTRGMTFSEIADFLEKHAEHYFVKPEVTSASEEPCVSAS